MITTSTRSLPAGGGAFATATTWFFATLRDWRARLGARRSAQALAHLDDRTLRDLGYDRSEITGVSAELHGLCDTTYARFAREHLPP